MKQRIRFLRTLLLGLGLTIGTLAPAFADTSWNTSVNSTDNLLTATNWTNDAPSLTNPGTIESATISVSADQTLNNTIFSVLNSTITSKNLYLTSESGASTKLTLGGTTNWSVSGSFIGLYNNKGTGWTDFVMTDSAKLTTTGNFWGGNANNTTAKPLTGNNYAQSYTFSGNSILESGGEFWIGMSAKTHVIIEGNASVSQKGGNQCGIGWDATAAGSVLDMTGGTLNIAITNQNGAFCIGRNGSGTMNQSGGTATVEKMQIGGGNVYNLSETGSLNVIGGTHGTIIIDPMLNNSGTINQSGGNLSTTKYSGGGTANLTGGTFSASYLTNSGALNVKTGGTLKATNIGGKVVVDGGTVAPDSLYVNSSGNLTLNTGSVAPVTNFTVGNNAGAATLNQTGGAVAFAGTNNVYFGKAADSEANVNLSGGTFTISAANLYLADNDTATATLILSGTAAMNTKQVSVGQHGTAVVEMNGNSQWTSAGGTFYTGQQDGAANAAITLNESANLITDAMYLGYGAGGSTGKNSLTLNGNSSVRVNGNFIPLKGFQDNSKTGGKGLVELTLNDNSSMNVTGNFWGGSNYAANYAAPLDGYDYVNYFTFSGNSSLSVGEFWGAMTAKTYIKIEDQASVTSRSGNSGIGWDGGSDGSLLEMSGGTFSALTFYIGNAKTADMTQTGGTSSFSSNLLINNADSVLTLSDDALMFASQINANKGTINLKEGGTLKTGNLVNSGTVQFNGGELILAPYGYIDTVGGAIEYNSGHVSMTMPTEMVFQAGDQVYLGKFANQEQADLFTSILNMDSNWTIGYDSSANNLVAAYGDSVKTDLKTWKDGTSGSMADSANWNGSAANSTGFVQGGTNTFSDFDQKVIVNGGTNTFNGAVETSERLVVNAGTNTYAPTAFSGELFVNAGTINTSGALAVNGTLENPGSLVFNGGTTKINGDLTTATTAGAIASVALAGSANVTVTGSFISLSGNKQTGYSLFTITDNASMTTGNFWGGKANESSAQPIAGRDYAAEYFFSGNSYLECKEFWVAMCVPTHIVLEDNAHVKSTINNTGIGWGMSAANSLFEQTGGTLESINVKIGESNSTAVLNWLQTGGVWTASGTFFINSPNAVYSISGANSSLTVGGTMTNSGAILVASNANVSVKGGLDNFKSLSVSGGTVAVAGTYNNKTGGTLNVSGGSFTANTLYLNGASRIPDNSRVH